MLRDVTSPKLEGPEMTGRLVDILSQVITCTVIVMQSPSRALLRTVDNRTDEVPKYLGPW